MQIGSYEVLGELARGGMGAVYRARHPASGQEVAIKVLHGLNEAQRRRFLTEVRTLSRLAHPHVIRVHESGEARGVPWLAMDLHAGGTLERRMAREPLAPREAATIAHALAQALDHAHRCGVLHRDVKPDNVLLAHDGRPVLTDFGLARDLAASQSGPTRTGAMLGTPGYWAPEQVSGEVEGIGPAADVWGLGATLFALLVGHPPFLDEDLPRTLHRLEHEPAPAPSSLRAEVDPGLDAIVLRCLEKAPAARYASAEALARDLAIWLRGQPPLALRAQARPVRRRRWRTGALLALLALVAGGALLAPPRRRDPAAELAALAAIATRAPPGPQREAELARLLTQAANLQADHQPAAAAAALDAALRLAPDSFDAWGLRIGVEMSNADFARADRHAGLAMLVLGPDHPQHGALETIRRSLGQAAADEPEALAAEGRVQTLEVALRQLDMQLAAPEAEPALRPQRLLERARGHAVLGRYEAARRDLDAAVALAPARALPERACLPLLMHVAEQGGSRGRALKDLERAALADAEAALRLVPDQPRALLARGWISELAEKGTGQRDLARALGLAPDDPDVLTACAVSLELPDADRILFFERAIERDPWQLRARLVLVTHLMAAHEHARTARTGRESLGWIPREHPDAGTLRMFIGIMAQQSQQRLEKEGPPRGQ